MQHDISDNCYYCGYGPQHRSPVWSTGHLGVCTITHADDPPENAKNKDKWRKFKMLPRNFGSGGGQIITLSTRAISKEMSLPNKAIPPLPPMPRVNPLHPHKPTQKCESCGTELPAICYWCRDVAHPFLFFFLALAIAFGEIFSKQ